ncbi:elongation factor 1-beta isoform 2-T2 [Hipposideros larvatus]
MTEVDPGYLSFVLGYGELNFFLTLAGQETEVLHLFTEQIEHGQQQFNFCPHCPANVPVPDLGGPPLGLPGVKKALGKYGPANVEDTTGSGATDSKDDDDIDLFGSDDEEESEEAKRLREERLAQYESKKAKKPALVAKSSILLDVKPWDDETDMAKLEECVRSIQADGLVWGSSKLVPVGYGIKKLQIQCVVEDDKVGTDMLEERITAFEDYVQSMDVAAFNKI